MITGGGNYFETKIVRTGLDIAINNRYECCFSRYGINIKLNNEHNE